MIPILLQVKHYTFKMLIAVDTNGKHHCGRILLFQNKLLIVLFSVISKYDKYSSYSTSSIFFFGKKLNK